MVRLQQDVGAIRRLDEHHKMVMEQLAEVHQRFHEARANVTLAQQVIDDTQADLDGVQRGAPPSTSSSSGSDTTLPANEDAGIAELESRSRGQEEAINHRRRKVERRRDEVHSPHSRARAPHRPSDLLTFHDRRRRVTL
jgi:hypothetical protein